MIHYVRVAVALSRPPKIDEWRRYCVVAATKQEAELIAQQMAACTSVMPVESAWESSHRAGPVEPYGVMGCRCWHVSWDEDLQCFTDPEVWEVAASCPHHSEDTAAWAALADGTGVPQDGSESSPGVLYGVNPNLRMPEQDPEEAALIASCEPAECPPGVHSMFDFCPGRAICEDGWQEPVDHGEPSDECRAGTCDCGPATHGSFADPPTPETANAGGPDTDDTPQFKVVGEHGPELPWRGPRKITLKVCPCGDIAHAPDTCLSTPVLHCRCGCPWPCKYFDGGQGVGHRIAEGPPYATGAVVPDELKRRVDTVKVSCTCERVDISVYADGPHRMYTRGRTDGDCPYHGDLAQIRAFGRIDVGDRLRVNDFGIWSITRYDDMALTIKPTPKFFPPPPPDLTPLAGRTIDPAPLSPGRVECTHCDDWSHSVTDNGPGLTAAYRALTAHRAATTADGTPECPRSPNQRRPSLWERMFRATMRLLPPVR